MARLKTKTPNKPWGVCERYLACSSMQEPDASPLPGWAWEGGIWLKRHARWLLCFCFWRGVDVTRMASREHVHARHWPVTLPR
jgi:hypothetical protein